MKALHVRKEYSEIISIERYEPEPELELELELEPRYPGKRFGPREIPSCL